MSSSHEPETRKLSDLRENPKSVEIYGADDISDLLESISREGVLEPLVIKPDGTILSGHRRFRAAKQLVGEGRVGSDVVPCRVVDVRDETGEKGLIIQFNRQRKKTFEQMMKEAQVLEAVEKTKAEERQRSGLLLGERRKLPSASGEANGPRQGKAAEAVAGEIGVSRATYERGKKVWDAAKQGDPTAQQLVVKLNRGEVTVSDAYQRVRSEEKQREKRAEMDRVRAAPILPSEGTLLGDCREEMKKLGDGSVALILTDVPFFITAEMAVHRLVNPMKFDPGLAQAQEELREFDVFGSQEEYFALMREWMTEAVRVLKPGGHLVSFVDRLKITEFAKIGESLGLAVRQPIYWLVSNPVPNADKRDFMSAVMSMIWFTKPGEGGGGRPTFNYQLGQHPNYFSAPYVSGAEKGRHPCLTPDSLVMTPLGFRPISDIRVGDKVLSMDGRFNSVLDVSSLPYDRDIFEIGVNGTNFHTKATHNHPFLVFRPNRRRRDIIGGTVCFVEAKNLRVGDYIVSATPDVSTTDQHPNDFWFVVGLWLAEGSFIYAGHGRNKYPNFNLHIKETRLVEKIAAFAGKEKVHVYRYKSKPNSMMVFVSDPKLSIELEWLCGRGAHAKVLAPKVWGLVPEKLRSLFEGYIAGDGGRVRNYIKSTTVSPRLASQLKFIGQRLGWRSNLWVETPPRSFPTIGGRKIERGLVYRNYFRQIRKGKWKGTRSRPMLVHHEGKEYHISRISSICRTPYRGLVWNLSIEGSPTFETAVGSSHNSQKPVSILKEIIGYLTYLGDVVLDPFMGSGSTLEAARELKRKAIGIEKDEYHYKTATQRLAGL